MVRTPASLSLASNRATASSGSSSLSVERVWSSSGTPSVRSMTSNTECESSDHRCDYSRLPAGTEYGLDVSGPNAEAIHVVAARGGTAAAAHTLLSGDGYRGVVIPRAGSPVAVVTNDSPDGQAQSSLAYSAPAGALHVVVDAPVDANGKSDVSATQDGSNCRVEVTPHADSSNGYPGTPLIVRLSSSCELEDDGGQAASNPPPGDGQGGSSGSSSTGSGAQGGTDTGAQGGTSGTGADGSGAQGGTAGTGADGSGAQGGTASNATGGTGGSSGSATAGSGGTGGRHHRRWWSSLLKGTVSTLDDPSSSDTQIDAKVPTSPGSGSCSVSAAPNGGPGGTLASALVGALLVLNRRRRTSTKRPLRA